jgi:hypothetical protein
VIKKKGKDMISVVKNVLVKWSNNSKEGGSIILLIYFPIFSEGEVFSMVSKEKNRDQV